MSTKYYVDYESNECVATLDVETFVPSQSLILDELRKSNYLGEFKNNKEAYLYDYKSGSATMHEIGRLREIAFRAVGEGTGLQVDLDRYDQYYRHLILWHQHNLDIIGAYRIGECRQILQTGKTLYTSTLFDFSEEMSTYLEQGVELGRSFVRPEYWRKGGLENLWYGIGAYLRRYNNARYLFGSVSISNAYPDYAKQLLVYFYQHYFGTSTSSPLAIAKRPYHIDATDWYHLQLLFADMEYFDAFRILKSELAGIGVQIPTLYKQYSELCEPGGVQFLAFSVDPDFGHCIDGLVLMDTLAFKTKKYEHYIGSNKKAHVYL